MNIFESHTIVNILDTISHFVKKIIDIEHDQRDFVQKLVTLQPLRDPGEDSKGTARRLTLPESVQLNGSRTDRSSIWTNSEFPRATDGRLVGLSRDFPPLDPRGPLLDPLGGGLDRTVAHRVVTTLVVHALSPGTGVPRS